jgi:cobalamin biosynthesis protein CobW
VFGDQLACADLVVLNKRDLVDGAALDAVRATLRTGLRAAVRIVEATQGAVPAAVLLGLAAAAEDDIEARRSCHDGEPGHDHDDFDSFQIARGPVEDPAGFARRIEAAMATHDILRVKGFLDIVGKPFRAVVQGVGGRVQHYFDRPWGDGETRASRLVVIGQKGIDRAAITAALAA